MTARLRQRLQNGDLSSDPSETPDEDEPKIDGYVNADRTCRGWDSATTVVDPATNGHIVATAVVENSKLNRGLWGTATSCRDRVPADSPVQVNVFLNGTLGVYLDAALPGSIDQAKMLVSFEGTVGTEQQQRQVSFDFRVNFPQIEVRVPVSDGDIIASVGDGDALVLRGSNGTFSCSVESGGCGGPE